MLNLISTSNLKDHKISSLKTFRIKNIKEKLNYGKNGTENLDVGKSLDATILSKRKYLNWQK